MLETKSRAFTLIELTLVVSMVAIIAVIGISSYTKSKNKALSKEALATLKLIATIEQIHKMESYDNAYVACADIVECNTKLKLYLTDTNWAYAVGVATGIATITANGKTMSGCVYTLSSGDFDKKDYTTNAGCL